MFASLNISVIKNSLICWRQLQPVHQRKLSNFQEFYKQLAMVGMYLPKQLANTTNQELILSENWLLNTDH